MDELERRLAQDMKSELVMSKRERQHLSEKLDCLILLIRRAWQGETAAIEEISNIVGIPPPNIIPPSKDTDENGKIGAEYLHLTSALLDEQLAEDASVKKTTSVLRPSSASAKRVSTASRRPRSATQYRGSAVLKYASPQFRSPENAVRSNSAVLHNGEANGIQAEQAGIKLASDKFPMADLTDIVPLFDHTVRLDKPQSPRPNPEWADDDSPLGIGDGDRGEPHILFNPNSIVGTRKIRPVSAALQRRQDYVRSQGKKKKPRPRSAMATTKAAFQHVSDYEYDTLIRSANGIPTPDGSPEQMESPLSSARDAPPAITVNISQKGPGRRRVSSNSLTSFPRGRDEQAFGDVTDALHRVQEMERHFRQNTKRLQQKIGIPAAGCI